MIEVPSPIASWSARQTAQVLCESGLHAHVVAHVRCVEADVHAALKTDVFGLNLFYGTSAELREYSHGRQIDRMVAEAVPLIQIIRSARRYVRFSAEDAFRSDLIDLLTVLDAVVDAGVSVSLFPLICRSLLQALSRIERVYIRKLYFVIHEHMRYLPRLILV